MYKMLAAEINFKSDIQITILRRVDTRERMSLYLRKYNFSVFCVQPVEKSLKDERLFGTIVGKKSETFFCIILQGKICVKIIPKVEKSTTQVKIMCYNIVGKKRVGGLCSEVKQREPKAFSSFCPNRMGQKPHVNRAEKNYC